MTKSKWKYPDLLTGVRKPALEAPASPMPPFDLNRLRTGLAGVAVRKGTWPALALIQPFGSVWRFGRVAVVTRAAEVRAVLSNTAEFEVPFGPEMTQLAGGTNFVLGQEGPEHDRQRRFIEAVVTRQDIARIGAMSRAYAEALLDAAQGEIDAQRDLVMRVATETCCRYFGLSPADPDAFAGWAVAISAVLFADPFGDPEVARLAANGAARLRAVIDDAIDHAHRVKDPGDDTLVARLVTLQRKSRSKKDKGPSDEEIRAILVGLVAGFIPTNSLAGGKILDFLAHHPEAVKAGLTAAGGEDEQRMRRVVLECARLNPALAPGQWRYCRNGGTIAGRRIKPGSVVVVATMAALRDRRAFPNPGRFDPDRAQLPDLLFGAGLHACIGRELATAQLIGVFMALLRRGGVDRALRRLKLGWLGPFPWQAPIRFDDPTRGHDPVIVAIPVAREVDVAALRMMVAALGNPADTAIRKELDATGLLHFASLNIADLPVKRGTRPYLLLELNVDGDGDTALGLIADRIEDTLRPIVAHACDRDPGDLGPLLLRHRLRFHTRPWGATGIEFDGRVGLSVATVARQAALAAFASDALDAFYSHDIGRGGRAANALNEVRRMIRDDSYLRADPRRRRLIKRGRAFDAFVHKPRSARLPIAVWQPPNVSGGGTSIPNLPGSRTLLQLALGIFLVVGTVLWLWLATLSSGRHPAWIDTAPRLALAAAGAATFVGLFAAALGSAVLYLRWKERRDPVDDAPASLAHIRAVTAHEDAAGFAQNHILAVNRMKPGPFRRATFALALWGIRQTVRRWFRPGFVVVMGTIHFARWFRVPGTEAMLFNSNYDGSWESYLEDFITRAHQGQSAVWSNAAGFPRTDLLINEGAANGDYFKRWVRKQQQPTAFWYSRFPKLTLQQIRNNALIHEGLSRATSESEARAWLTCFGSIRQPLPDALDFAEVQALVFDGFPRLPCARFLVLRLPEDPIKTGNWLCHVAGFKRDDPEPGMGYAPIGAVPPPKLVPEFRIAFGETDRSRATAAIAFSHAGLKRVGVPDLGDYGGLADFAPPFRMSMAGRAATLGDRGDEAPPHWRWRDDGERAVHALLALYACDEVTLGMIVAAHEAELARHDVTVIDTTCSVPPRQKTLVLHKPPIHGHIPSSPLEPKQSDHFGFRDEPVQCDHFGFRDGLVQPAIAGTTRAARNPVARDRVAPGEFLLGYRNAAGRYPPPIRLPDDQDLLNRLPDIDDRVDQSIPDFGVRADRAVVRDLGRNGTFLAVRVLAQDIDGFRRQTEAAAEHIAKNYPNLGRTVDRHWVAAKMVGRWPSGAPLVGHPVDPGHIDAHDYDIAFGAEDPLGVQCPLGAHVRRANPRDSLVPGDDVEQAIINRHRIIRRGRSYACEDGERGLFFIAVCADLERQFEFIQQTWVASPTFHGLVGEPDPLVARDEEGKANFSIPTTDGTIRVPGLSRFVSTKAGGYFFMPSRSALRYFARYARPD